MNERVLALLLWKLFFWFSFVDGLGSAGFGISHRKRLIFLIGVDEAMARMHVRQYCSVY
jgi:hypothetical protein